MRVLALLTMSTAVVPSPTCVIITRSAVSGESPLTSNAIAHSSAAKTMIT